MNRPLVLALALVAGATIATTPASAAKPKKPITGTFTQSDPTPDPTGNATTGNQNHCTGKLPQEKPFQFKAPAAGKLKVELSGFQGDWALQILDDKGNVLGGDDVTPDTAGTTESATVKIRKKMTVGILPCNMGGGPSATAKYTFTYA